MLHSGVDLLTVQLSRLLAMFMSVLRQQSAVSGVFNRLRCLSVSMNARTVHASAHPVIYLLPTQTATEDVAALYSAGRELKDVHLISGTLGAGKSTFWCVQDVCRSLSTSNQHA